MARALRNTVGGFVYHCINRANARVQIFDKENDYLLFENILMEGVEKYGMRILAYCIMPNHWHLVLYPKQGKDMPEFMGWITNTHTKRWHAIHHSTGTGHLYQGRYKSFLCQTDNYFLALVRYVERNALRANLVKKAQDWRWSSVWRREHGTAQQKQFLFPWPVAMPDTYLAWLNEAQTEDEVNAIRRSIQRESPYGEEAWIQKMAKKYNLESTLRARGRPKKGG